MWALLDRTHCLQELMEDRDKEGKNWVLYAAEAGNRRVFQKIGYGSEGVYAQFSETDNRGWNGFMYAARGRGVHSAKFLKILRRICLSGPGSRGRLTDQLTRVADREAHGAVEGEIDDADPSTLLMHAATGGSESYALVCEMMREADCAFPLDERFNKGAILLSWAAEGGDNGVLDTVAEGIRVRASVQTILVKRGNHGMTCSSYLTSSPRIAPSVVNAYIFSIPLSTSPQNF